MLAALDLTVLVAAAFGAAMLGAVAGFGMGAVLLPVLILNFGVRDGVLILAIASLFSNGSRVWFNRREIDLQVVGWFSLGSIPLTVAGAFLFVVTPASLLLRLMGLFMLSVVAWRRLRTRPPRPRSVRWFLPLGAGFGFLSGLVEGLGPLIAPFLLAHGLMRSAYIGTDALISVLKTVTKLTVFVGADILGPRAVTAGLILAPSMFLGSLVGKKVLDRLPERVFVAIIEVTLLVAGTIFLFRG